MNWKTKLAYVLLLLVGTIFNGPFLTEAADCDSCISCFDKDRSCRQFYLGGIVGADFATLDKVAGQPTTIPAQSLFTAGGTAGMRFLRDHGALRLEFEGRGRDQASVTVGDPATDSITTRATDGWSAMVNVWRDYKPFENLGVYAGGGIGAGGYRWTIGGTGLGSNIEGNDRISNFAWQAGTGVFYDVSERATIDLGYRFFAVNESTAGYTILGSPVSDITNFAASELLLTFRIYEPFRSWRDR
jgi:opacity protein-like surface antigen